VGGEGKLEVEEVCSRGLLVVGGTVIRLLFAYRGKKKIRESVELGQEEKEKKKRILEGKITSRREEGLKTGEAREEA